MGCCCSKESERNRGIERKKDNEGNLRQEQNREIQSETITDQQPKEHAKSSSEINFKGETPKEEANVGMESDRGKKKSAPSTSRIDADCQLDDERAKEAMKLLTEASRNLGIKTKNRNEENQRQNDNRVNRQSETNPNQPIPEISKRPFPIPAKRTKEFSFTEENMNSKSVICDTSRIEADRQFDMDRAKKATEPLTELSLGLFKKIAAKNPSENIVFSPISIALALAMIESGADYSTRTALRNVLGGNDNDFDTSAVYQSIQRLLRFQEGETSLIIANGLFHDLKFTLKTEYLSKVKECFDSEIDGVDFVVDTQAAASRINSWISERTEGRIKDLLRPGTISDKTVVLLINAIYSKAKWRVPFRKEAIETMPFYRQGQDANPQMVPFLTEQNDYMYVDDTDFQAVGIPYSSISQSLAFYIILPKERDGIRKVEEQLTEAKLRSIAQTRHQREIDLCFPKFGMRTPIGLKAILTELGLGPIFEETADFGRMSNQPLHVSDVIHEAFIKVDEHGTEAAAATAVVYELCSHPGRVVFMADHPFIFAIVHQQTETIVFLGKVNHVEEDAN